MCTSIYQGYIHQQLHDNPPTQRKREDQQHERSMTGRHISPKLCRAALESIFQRLSWETRGLTIDGAYLSHLRFAADKLISANTLYELQQMLQEVEDKGDDMCQQHVGRER